MEIREEKVRLGFTQNLGNFESLRADVELTATLSPGESLDDLHNTLYAAVEQRLIESAKDVHGSLSKDAKRKTQIDPE